MTHPTGPLYYVRTRGRVQGPLTAEKLKLLRARGQFGRASEVSLDGYTWSQASAFKELFEQPVKAVIAQPAATGAGGSVVDEPAFAFASPQPESLAPRRMHPAFWMVSVLLLSGVAFLTTAVVLRHSRAPHADPGPNSPGRSRPRQPSNPVAGAPIGRIDLSEDNKELDAAIALVVCGWLVELSDGTHKELVTFRGTGFCISREGHLLTNQHVIESTFKELRSESAQESIAQQLSTNFNWSIEALTPQVWVFFNHRRSAASIVHVSDSFDMAILLADEKPQHYFALCVDPDTPRGAEVLALGFPGAADTAKSVEELAKREVNNLILQSPTTDIRVEKQLTEHSYDLTLTSGIVSRPPYEDDDALWIQHSAPISGGNSGGPLVSQDGRVVGINTSGPKEAQGIFNSLSMPQLREEIDAHVPDVVWK